MSALQRQIMADTPLAWWPMDEASGSLLDATGNGRTMSLTGTVARQAAVGPFRGVDFDGATGYAFRADEAWQTLQAHTLEAWVVIDAFPGDTPGSAGIILKDRNAGDAGGGPPYGLSVMSPSGGSVVNIDVRESVADGATFASASSAALTTARLYHVASRWSGTTVDLFVDAELVATQTVAAMTLWDSTRQLFLGRGRSDIAGRFLNGKMANAAIFGTALTADRIRAHYEAGMRAGVVVG